MLNSAFGHANPGWAHIHHVRHCLGYLRTSILCRPDLTLEPGDFTQRDFDVDWVGETHSCRDHSVIYDFLDKNFDDWEARTEVGLASNANIGMRADYRAGLIGIVDMAGLQLR